MTAPQLVDQITSMLSTIYARVIDDGRQNLQDKSIFCENLMMHLLNDVNGWHMVNANGIRR